MGEQGLVQEIEDGSFLEPEGLHDGADAFDEAATVVAVAAESVFASQHAGT